MCGINGIFAYHYAATAIDRAELRRTRDHMAHRGPDGSGEWIDADSRVGLGHRRLSIIDLSEAGAQPMLGDDTRYVVTFNGEIYNHRELRAGLEAKGYRFRSQCDTEVLLHLYADKGAAMVRDLRGMFAFAIWDSVRRQMFLARDPYGIKPLYYSDDGWTLRFASQVKALVAGGRCDLTPDPAGYAGFYMFGSVPEPHTMFASIRSLPAGTTLTVDCRGAGEAQRYHELAELFEPADGSRVSARDSAALVREALIDSVRHHLIADVSVGAFLSAGIDSGSLVGLMRDAGSADIQTVTVAFAEFENTDDDESPLAAEVARQYGTRHVRRVVTREEFEADFPKILLAMDQPSIDGFNAWFVSKAAHQLGLKVAISGLGGDELFGGYASFTQIPRLVRAACLPSRIPMLARATRTLATAADLSRWGISPKMAGLLEFGGTYAGAYLLRRGVFMPWELERVMGAEFAREGLRRLQPMRAIGASMPNGGSSEFAKVAALESSLYMRNQLLRDADWASMAHSLEVRVPLVDSTLLAACARQFAVHRPAPGKALLADSPSRPLSRAVTGRRKTGFTTPILRWMTDKLEQQTDLPAVAGAARGTLSGNTRNLARYVAGTCALV